jgi:hypothetical protein
MALAPVKDTAARFMSRFGLARFVPEQKEGLRLGKHCLMPDAIRVKPVQA